MSDKKKIHITLLHSATDTLGPYIVGIHLVHYANTY